MTRKFVFFYHYNKITKSLSLHYKKKCYMVTNIDCQVRAYSKHNLEQPRLIFKGLCNTIVIDKNNYATIT